MPTLSSAGLSGRRAFALSTLGALAFALPFWISSFDAARGYFPAPLDDVYIHFDFAKALAQGHPFAWIGGQGFSSGETSPLYAVLLAVGWLLGFHGKALALWAALIAVLSTASLVRSTRELLAPCPGWCAWLLAFVPLSVAIVDWTLFSGMEMATFVAALGRALVWLRRSRQPPSSRRGTREQAQWRLGLWGAAACLLRPEAALLVGIFAVFAARGAGHRSGFAAAGRASLPGALATLTILGLNRVFTGHAQSAGAQLKLLSSNPWTSDEDRAHAFVENLVTFFVKVLRSELPGGRTLFWVVPALALLGMSARRHRAVAAACVTGALSWVLIVSWNGNAPFHNFRYYAPALVLLLLGASLGLASLVRGPRSAMVVAVAASLLSALESPRFPEQTRHFRRSVANIRDQQVEAGERLARLTAPDSRILLGDAGAIPFVSGRGAIDALGLGGFQRVPFARAAVHGESATIELVERLPASERPTHFALYPNWFGLITSRFGHELDRVTITDNVICGGTSKVIYAADWSALSSDGRAPSPDAHDVLDEIDVADVISEEAHAYVAPLPKGGFTTLEVLKEPGAIDARFDGGRIIPRGMQESFVLSASASCPVRVVVRVDHDATAMRVTAHGQSHEVSFEPAAPGTWRHGSVTLDHVAVGDRVVLEATEAYRNYHVWITRP